MNSAIDIVINRLLELDRLRSVGKTGAAAGVNAGNLIENINSLRKAISDDKSAFELKLKEAENNHQRLWELLDNKNAETVILDQQLTQAEGEQSRLSGVLNKKAEEIASLEETKLDLEQKLAKIDSAHQSLRNLLDQKDISAVALAQKISALEQTNQTLETINKEAAQENELLLLQLHHVQEELEAVFLQKQQLQQAQKEQTTKQQQLQAQVEKLTATRDDLTRRLDNRAGEITSLTQMLKDAESGKVALLASLDEKTTEACKLAEEANQRLEHQQDIISRNDMRISELNKNLSQFRAGLSKQIESVRQAIRAEDIKHKGLHLRSGGALVPVRKLFSMAAEIARNDKAIGKGGLRIYKKSFYRLFKYGVTGAVARLECAFLKIRPELEDSSTPGIREKLTLRTLEEMQLLLNSGIEALLPQRPEKAADKATDSETIDNIPPGGNGSGTILMNNRTIEK
jgi:hypothetical protein